MARLVFIATVVVGSTISFCGSVNAQLEGSVGILARYFYDDLSSAREVRTLGILNLETEADFGNSAINLDARISNQGEATKISEALVYSNIGLYSLSVGAGQVFWGVAESNHLVDIINQTDLSIDTSGEDKFAQPWVSIGGNTDSLTFETYIMPYFMERNVSLFEGRFGLGINTDVLYQSDSGNKHIDLAARLFAALDNRDFAVSLYHGTARTPLMIEDGQVEYYRQITQLGFEYLVNVKALQIKAETAISKDDNDSNFASVIGFEQTYVGVMGSSFDLGLILEYSYDSQSWEQSSSLENDLFGGLRFSVNDIAGSYFLVGTFHDLRNHTSIYSIEGKTRLNDAFSAELNLRYYGSVAEQDRLSFIRGDSYIDVTIVYHF